MGITLNDTFTVCREQPLTAEDYRTLTRMYLPIIGIDSFGLYALLQSMEENIPYSFKKPIDVLNLQSLSYLENSFSKLEAVSLIDGFFHEKKGYAYILKNPLSAREFLENPLLNSFLSSQIGEIELNKLKQVHQEFPLKGYKNITKSFDEVFTVSEDCIENEFSRIFKAKNRNPVKVLNSDFDYIFFKMNFDSNFIDPKILDDEEFRQQILTISFNYKLNEEEMKEVILQTIAADKDLKYSDISKNARILYQSKNKNTKKRFVTKEPDAFLDSRTDDDTYRFIQSIENIAPADLLEQLNGGIKPAISELKMIEDLINNTNFPVSVINIMILMVNNEKEGVLPNYNYFEKIANTWARANVKTAQDAINYINKSKAKAKDIKYTRGKKEATLPDWYDKYQKELEKLPKEKELSQDEIEKILADAKTEYDQE